MRAPTATVHVSMYIGKWIWQFQKTSRAPDGRQRRLWSALRVRQDGGRGRAGARRLVASGRESPFSLWHGGCAQGQRQQQQQQQQQHHHQRGPYGCVTTWMLCFARAPPAASCCQLPTGDAMRFSSRHGGTPQKAMTWHAQSSLLALPSPALPCPALACHPRTTSTRWLLPPSPGVPPMPFFPPRFGQRSTSTGTSTSTSTRAALPARRLGRGTATATVLSRLSRPPGPVPATRCDASELAVKPRQAPTASPCPPLHG